MTRHAELRSYFQDNCKVKRIGRGHYTVKAKEPGGLNSMLKMQYFVTDLMNAHFLINAAYWLSNKEIFTVHIIDNKLLGVYHG